MRFSLATTRQRHTKMANLTKNFDEFVLRYINLMKTSLMKTKLKETPQHRQKIAPIQHGLF